MTPTPAPQEARTQNAPRIYLFVRARRLLGALSLVMLAFASTASALPMGVPALPATPDLPAVDKSITTPLGTTDVKAHDGKVTVCNNYAASTQMLPAAPAVPALPVQAPVALPALPDTSAGAKANACAHVDGLSAKVDAGASAYGAGKKADLKADAQASENGIGGGAEAKTGFFDAIVRWFQSLF